VNILEACNVLDIKDMRTVSIEEVKKTYKTLAKKHHPDMGGDGYKMGVLNQALELVLDGINKRAKHTGLRWEKIMYIMRLEDLLDIIVNGEGEIQFNKESKTVDRNYIKNALKPAVEITVNIKSKKEEIEYKQISAWSESGVYDLDYRLDCGVGEDIEVGVGEKKIVVNIRSKATQVNINICDGITVRVYIERSGF